MRETENARKHLEAVVIDEIEQVAVAKEFVHQDATVVVKEAALHIHHRTSLFEKIIIS